MSSQEADSPLQPRDGFEAAVFEIFQSMLGRFPTTAECTEWTGKLSRGVPIGTLRDLLEAHPDRRETPAAGADDGREVILGSGLFDAAWYRRRNADIDAAGIDPLDHYTAHGWQEGRAPNPWFDPAWYRATHNIADQDPLTHYISTGEASGLRPSRWFDPAWYRATYRLNPNRSPLADFLRHRHDGTVAPSPEMWPALGLRDRPLTETADDVFLSLGDTPADEAVLRDAGLFDENYYALHSGDVLDAGADMLTHYCAFGWREKRQPNFYFDTEWYSATNPEVAALGVNPLAHYYLVGEPEGRRPIVFFDPVWYARTYAVPDELSPLAHFLAHRRGGTVSPNEFFDPVWYAEQRGEKPRPGRDPFARFLVAGLTEDTPPSPAFDLAAWRKATTGRVSRHFRHMLDPVRDNPLVRYLLTTYR